MSDPATIDRLLGRVVRACDELWEAENVAIAERSALPDGLAWEFTSAKMDLDRLRSRLAALSETAWAERRRLEDS